MKSKLTRARLEQALREAIPHVWRQQFAGKHEQDKADAKQWWAKFKDVRDELPTGGYP